MLTRTAWLRPGRLLDLLMHLPTLGRLCWRLVRDPRVSVWPKLLLAGAVAYVIVPFDLVPDVLPVIGRVDDVVVLLAASRWFVAWCPPAVVREHRDAIDMTG